MGTPVVGDWQAAWTDSAGAATLQFVVPAQFIEPGQTHRRFRRESGDGSLIDVVVIGSGHKEIAFNIALESDPVLLMRMIEAGMDGRTITLSPDGGSTTYPSKLIEPGGNTYKLLRDPQTRPVFKDYTIAVRFRRIDGGNYDPLLT